MLFSIRPKEAFSKAARQDSSNPIAGFRSGPGYGRIPSPPKIESESVYLSSIKLAEDDSGDLILRLVEYRGKSATAMVRLPQQMYASGVQRTNLLERNGEALSLSGGSVSLKLRPWEITTFRLHSEN